MALLFTYWGSLDYLPDSGIIEPRSDNSTAPKPATNSPSPPIPSRDFDIDVGIDPIIPPDEGTPVPDPGQLVFISEETESFIAYLPSEMLEKITASGWFSSITPLPTPAP